MSADWSFARKPFWLFSHVFVAVSVISFLVFAGWQWGRHQDRSTMNAAIEQRSAQDPVDITTLLDKSPDEVEYQAVTATGVFEDGEFVEVANRTQAAVPGRWLVGLFRLDDGRLILLNRGFIPLHESAVPLPAPSGSVTITGWLRSSAERGILGATDDGQRHVVPRLDIDALSVRVSEPLAPVWLQQAPPTQTQLATFPDPVPLPELHPGPHLGYVGQWIIFAVMTAGFYVVILNRKARPVAGVDIAVPLDPVPTNQP